MGKCRKSKKTKKSKNRTVSTPGGRLRSRERQIPALVTPHYDAVTDHIHAGHLYPFLGHLDSGEGEGGGGERDHDY